MTTDTTDIAEEKCNRLKAKHEAQFNALFEELEYLREKIPYPIASKLKSRLSKTLQFGTLEASKFYQYPDPNQLEQMTIPAMQPFRFGAFGDAIKCRFGTVSSIKKG